MDDWIEEQRKDENCRAILEKISDIVPPSKELKKRYIILKNGIICTKDGRIVVPKGKVREVLKLCHDHPLSGHMGIQRTLSRLQPKFTWPEMAADTIDYINSCETCLKRKLTGETIAPLSPVKATKVLMKKMAADICGPVRESRQGNKFILVLADYASRYAFTAAMPDQTAKTVAKHLRRIFMQVGAPETLITDRGTNFVSATVKSLCDAFQIKRTTTSAFHAMADGLVERLNRTIADMLASYVSETPDLWDEYLDFITMAYNTSKHSSTKYTPYELFMGRLPNLPIDIEPNLRYRAVENEGDLISQQWSNALATAKKNLKIAQEKQKANYDKKTKLKTYKKGDSVLLREPPKPGKYNLKWAGPFEVTKKYSDLNYQIKSEKNNKLQIVHINRLKYFPKTKEIGQEREKTVKTNVKNGEGSENLTTTNTNDKTIPPIEIRNKVVNEVQTTRENAYPKKNLREKTKEQAPKKTNRIRKQIVPVRTYNLRTRTRPAGV